MPSPPIKASLRWSTYRIVWSVADAREEINDVEHVETFHQPLQEHLDVFKMHIIKKAKFGFLVSFNNK